MTADCRRLCEELCLAVPLTGVCVVGCVLGIVGMLDLKYPPDARVKSRKEKRKQEYAILSLEGPLSNYLTDPPSGAANRHHFTM